MERRLLDIKVNLKQPWLLSILFTMCIPIFPEYFAPFLAVAAFVAAVTDAKRHDRKIQIGLLGKILALYIVYMAAGIFYTGNPSSTLATTMMWVVMFLVYLSMTTVLTNKNRLDSVMFCMCLVGGTVGLIGTVQYGLYALFHVQSTMQFWSFIDNIVYQILPIEMFSSGLLMRPSSTFNNPNIFAEYLVITIPFVAFYAFSGRRTKARVFCRLCFLFSMMGILFSFSRGSYIALLMVLVVFCIANIRKILLIMMGVVSALLFVPEEVIKRFFYVSTSDGERLSIWRIGLEQAGDSPLFGYGAGVANSWDILFSNGVNAPHMHNLYLQLLTEGGIVALALMGAVGWKLFRASYAMLQNYGSEARAVGVALIAFIAAFCTHGLVDFPLMTPKLVGVFLVIIAIGDVAAQLYMHRATSPAMEFLPRFSKKVMEESDIKIYTPKSKEQ